MDGPRVVRTKRKTGVVNDRSTGTRTMGPRSFRPIGWTLSFDLERVLFIFFVFYMFEFHETSKYSSTPVPIPSVPLMTTSF